MPSLHFLSISPKLNRVDSEWSGQGEETVFLLPSFHPCHHRDKSIWPFISTHRKLSLWLPPLRGQPSLFFIRILCLSSPGACSSLQRLRRGVHVFEFICQAAVGCGKAPGFGPVRLTRRQAPGHVPLTPQEHPRSE